MRMVIGKDQFMSDCNNLKIGEFVQSETYEYIIPKYNFKTKWELRWYPNGIPGTENSVGGFRVALVDFPKDKLSKLHVAYELRLC